MCTTLPIKDENMNNVHSATLSKMFLVDEYVRSGGVQTYQMTNGTPVHHWDWGSFGSFSSVYAGLKFANQHFENVLFNGTTLRECLFEHCKFTTCVIRDVRFDDCNFVECDFSNCEISNSQFNRPLFYGPRYFGKDPLWTTRNVEVIHTLEQLFSR